MRERRRDVGEGGEEEFHSDSECKLEVEEEEAGSGGEREQGGKK